MDAAHYYRHIDELVEKAKQGDVKALGEIRSIYAPLISASIRRCLAKIPEAAPFREDLDADAILVLKELLQSYEPELSYFSYYLSTRFDYAIVSHCKKSYLKGSSDVSLDSLSFDIVDDAQIDPLAKILENDAISRALNNLMPKQREAIVLYFFEDLTQEAAAAKLKITQASFCKRLQRGLNAMKVLLSLPSKE